MFGKLPIEKKQAIGAVFGSDEKFMDSAQNGVDWVEKRKTDGKWDELSVALVELKELVE